MFWTHFCTCAAVCTLIIINGCIEVCNMDCVMLTSLHTLHTTNTACLADFHCFCTLICIDAKYMMFLLEWYKCDHMLRTCLHTDTTANTLVLIDHSQTVMNNDCLLRANSCTVTMAKAAICTCAVAGKHQAHCLTCVNTIIDEFLTCI